MKRHAWFPWMAASLAMLAWLLALLTVPPLDYDEALYRRMAEELGRGQGGDRWLVPRWDGTPMFDKPATFIWVIRAVSALWDSGGVSTFSARFSGWLFSVITAVTLAFFWPRIAREAKIAEEGSWIAHPALPVILYALCLLPSAGASLVLLDPFLTASLTLPLCIFTRCWASADGDGFSRAPGRAEVLLVGLCLGLATAIKGLIGILLPGFAIVLQIGAMALLGSRGTRSVWARFWKGTWLATRHWAASFAMGSLIGAAFYLFIWYAGGEEFVREFFLTHHFRRGSSAMEGHGGPFYYHFLVVLAGGFPLTFFLLGRLAGGAGLAHLRRLCFPWAWLLSFLLFFSFMATKLPNYMWPAWPALVLGGGGILASGRNAPGRTTRLFAVLIPTLGVGVAIALCAAPVALLFVAPHVDGRARAIIEALGAPDVRFFLGAAGAGIAFLAGTWFVRRALLYGQELMRLAVATVAISVFMLMVGWGMAPLAVETFVSPLERLARRASLPPYSTLPLTTWGLRSPTVSSFYDSSFVPQQWSGRRDFGEALPPLVLAPVWKHEVCRAQGHEVREFDRYVGLCVAPGGRE